MKLAALLAAAVLALPAVSQSPQRHPTPLDFSSASWTVPVMVNTSGMFSSFFKTRAALMNPTGHALQVHVALYDGAGSVHEGNIDLGAGQIKSYENFLDSVLSYSGAGTVKLSAVGGSPNDQFIVNTEVWTEGAGGRYGTEVPAFPYSGSGADSYSAGIWVDSSARTNVACFNDSAAANTIRADVFDGSNTKLGSVTLTLPARAWGQAGVPTPVSGGYVVFHPAGPATCYAVVVNNTSNDGHFIAAAEYQP